MERAKRGSRHGQRGAGAMGREATNNSGTVEQQVREGGEELRC